MYCWTGVKGIQQQQQQQQRETMFTGVLIRCACLSARPSLGLSDNNKLSDMPRQTMEETLEFICMGWSLMAMSMSTTTNAKVHHSIFPKQAGRQAGTKSDFQRTIDYGAVKRANFRGQSSLVCLCHKKLNINLFRFETGADRCCFRILILLRMFSNKIWKWVFKIEVMSLIV